MDSTHAHVLFAACGWSWMEFSRLFLNNSKNRFFNIV